MQSRGKLRTRKKWLEEKQCCHAFEMCWRRKKQTFPIFLKSSNRLKCCGQIFNFWKRNNKARGCFPGACFPRAYRNPEGANIWSISAQIMSSKFLKIPRRTLCVENQSAQKYKKWRLRYISPYFLHIVPLLLSAMSQCCRAEKVLFAIKWRLK